MTWENLSGISLLGEFRNSYNINNIMVGDLNWAMGFEMFIFPLMHSILASKIQCIFHFPSLHLSKAAALIEGTARIFIALIISLSFLDALISQCIIHGMVKIIFPKWVALCHLPPPKPLLFPNLTSVITSIMNWKFLCVTLKVFDDLVSNYFLSCFSHSLYSIHAVSQWLQNSWHANTLLHFSTLTSLFIYCEGAVKDIGSVVRVPYF